MRTKHLPQLFSATLLLAIVASTTVQAATYYTLTISSNGLYDALNGDRRVGKVTSSDGRINCAGCKRRYRSGKVVVLHANPDTGFGFSGWTGSCKHKRPICTVRMNRNRRVNAAFMDRPSGVTYVYETSEGMSMAKVAGVSTDGRYAVAIHKGITYTVDRNTARLVLGTVEEVYWRDLNCTGRAYVYGADRHVLGIKGHPTRATLPPQIESATFIVYHDLQFGDVDVYSVWHPTLGCMNLSGPMSARRMGKVIWRRGASSPNGAEVDIGQGVLLKE